MKIQSNHISSAMYNNCFIYEMKKENYKKMEHRVYTTNADTISFDGGWHLFVVVKDLPSPRMIRAISVV